MSDNVDAMLAGYSIVAARWDGDGLELDLEHPVTGEPKRVFIDSDYQVAYEVPPS